MTGGAGVCLVTLLVLVSPGSTARGSWRFPDSSPSRLDDKVRFVDTSTDRDVAVDLYKNRISDEPSDVSRQYCVCSDHHSCEESHGSVQQAVCKDGSRLCCYSTPREHAGRNAGPSHSHERHPSGATAASGQRLRDDTANTNGLFSPTQDVRPGAAGRDRQKVNRERNKFYITYIEDYPGLVEPVHSVNRPRRPSDTVLVNSYFNPYATTFSAKSEKFNKNRYFLAGPDELSGDNGPADFGGEHGARGHSGILAGPEGPTGSIGPNDPYSRPGTTGVLVGPNGPVGSIGPRNPNNGLQQSGILVGPDGPTGIIGPGKLNNRPGSAGVLVGPDGPTGHVGPDKQYSRPDVLVGPGGPTGVLGPRKPENILQYSDVLVGHDGPGKPYRRPETAAVLVGPGGPTGLIGPNPNRQYGRPQPAGAGVPVGPDNVNKHKQHIDVLVGPGGPTGLIGPNPNRQYGRPQPAGAGVPVGPNNVNKHKQHIDVLVGPGGPSGIIGPGRPYDRQGQAGVLVGPGGPTGNIGPYYIQRQRS